MKVINKTRNIILATDCSIAAGFWARIKGLLGESSMQKGAALVLKPCNSIHSFFMRFTIDALFIDKNHRVVYPLASLKPFRMSPVFFKASCVIELPAGTLIPDSVQIGDIISLE